MVAGASLVVLTLAVAGAGYLFVNHLASSIHRIPNIAALVAANQPAMPIATRGSMTVLLTGSMTLPGSRSGQGALGSSQSAEDLSGLIALIHLNADQRGGAVVSIPPNAVVDVPGHGQMELWQTLVLGGPSLLIESVEHLTNVRIDHYSVLDFAGVRAVIAAMNGVDVDVPFAVISDGFSFHAGTNLLTSSSVLPYVRQADVSEIGRVLLQQNLVRTILDKIAQRRMFTRIATDFRVVRAMSGALSVDSNFSNSQLESLALDLGHLDGADGVFVSAPTNGSPTTGGTDPVNLNQVISGQLWSAIRHDSVAEFARRYPFTVTPGAPG
jgi:LCP family protein required for cell wall assembly